jgi:hypothetical protein
MKAKDIIRYRLNNQHLLTTQFNRPEEVVQNLCAVQAQDYAGALWGLGLQLLKANEDSVGRAFAAGAILRTHILRPTWHFVTPADIRWLLMLTAPRVQAFNAYQYRKCELDERLFARCRKVLEKVLQGGQQLTRNELGDRFEAAGINTQIELRLTHIMAWAELEGVVCSGARRGKQFTYALLEERVAPTQPIPREEALAEMTLRYFKTRGPATLHDFAWWSGLTVTEAKRGIELVKTELQQATVDNLVYWFAEPAALIEPKKPLAFLLPNYDEYFIGLKDRSAINMALKALPSEQMLSALSGHILIVNGIVVGGWKRTLQKKSVSIEVKLLSPLTQTEQKAVHQAAERYGTFLGLPVSLAYA